MDLFRGTVPVIVAVVDSGVALDHPDLTLSLNINTRELNDPLGVDDDGNGYVDDFAGYDFYSVDSLASDENGHGTLVASLIAAGQNNRIGGVGICPTARIMPLRAFDQFGQAGVPKFARVSDVVQAYEYARQNGARIVNCSFGGSSFSSTELLTLRGLSSAGVLVVAAAGNGGIDGRGDNNDLTPQYPASYDVENLIAVAAQDRSGSLAGFSNYGPTRVHLAAPGTQIFGADVNRRVIYSESFNSGASGWTVNSAPGNLSPFPWRLASVSGNGFLADRLGGSLLYEPFTNTYAQSPLLNFSGVVGARLTFDAGYALADDFLLIEISFNGVDWFFCDYRYGSSVNDETVQVDIAELDGLSGYFRFRLLTNGSNHGGGVVIDNVSVSAVTIFDPANPKYKYSDGTSFAAPLVAGVAALVMSQRPDLTTSQVRSIILSSARPLSALSGKVSTGGMLDAERAIQLANSTANFAIPSIATQPTGQTVAVGGSVTFAVNVSGNGPFSYQWRKDGTTILGATGSALTLSNVQTTASGSYTVVVTNAAGSVTSNAATVTVNIAIPSIATQPTGQTVAVGGSVTFVVNVSGTAPFSYQWRKNGTTILGATGSALTLSNVQTTASGSYTVVVTNAAGSVTSNTATVTVSALIIAPTISLQPAAASVAVGGRTTLSVSATGTGPFNYQWLKDSVVLSGATSAELTLNSVQIGDLGFYTVAVSNSAGSITSNIAFLKVIEAAAPPAITLHPAAITIVAGSGAQFTVNATGTAPLSFQWSKNGVSIPGATGGTLTLTNVQPTDAGSYAVVVGNVAGNTTSSAATLTVNVPAAISAQPISQSLNAGTAATFTVAATGTAPLTYQWRKDGTPILGATTASLTLSSVQPTDAAAYTVVISNPAGSSTSNVAILAVTIPNPGRLINLSVLTDIATAGDDFTLGYVVGGSGSLGAKPLVIRAAGPSLGAFGVPGTLDDPKLELFARSTKTSENDNWGGSPQLTAALAAVGAFAYTGPASKDAATTASITTRDNSCSFGKRA